ncbi:MAG: hypothetical protein Q4A66_13085, partial [Eubacteriales bacterium]|nr:hypothetical protein [Eubacteriales bacterium]
QAPGPLIRQQMRINGESLPLPPLRATGASARSADPTADADQWRKPSASSITRDRRKRPVR